MPAPINRARPYRGRPFIPPSRPGSPPRFPGPLDLELPQSRQASCTACPLHAGCRHAGLPALELEGSPGQGHAVLVIWSRAPYFTDDQSGTPFTGEPADTLWTSYLSRLAHWDTTLATYALNVVRCWLPANAPPTRSHLRSCYPHTLRDLLAISTLHPSSPMAWLTLGKEAAQSALLHALNEKAPESLDDAFRANARTVLFSPPHTPSRPIFLLHTYHPSAVLRNANHLPHVHDHLSLLSRFLRGDPLPPSSPTIVPPFPPPPHTRKPTP